MATRAKNVKKPTTRKRATRKKFPMTVEMNEKTRQKIASYNVSVNQVVAQANQNIGNIQAAKHDFMKSVLDVMEVEHDGMAVSHNEFYDIVIDKMPDQAKVLEMNGKEKDE